MKTRDVVIFSGKKFKVPQCVQRIDHRYTHGWQVRYGGTKMFSDGTNDGSGAKASLEAATKELIRRIGSMPTPSKLQPRPSTSKSSNLPVGISGPLVRLRRGSNTRYASLQVLLPQFGEKPRNKNVYIGSESTYTPERFKEALGRAVELRAKAEKTYRLEETRSRRAEAKAMKDALAGAKSEAKPAAKAAKPAPVKAAAKAPAKVAKTAAKTTAKTATKTAAKAAPKKAAAKAPAKGVAVKAAAKKKA